MFCFAVAFVDVVAAADIELYYAAIFFNEFQCVGAIRSKSVANKIYSKKFKWK